MSALVNRAAPKAAAQQPHDAQQGAPAAASASSNPRRAQPINPDNNAFRLTVGIAELFKKAVSFVTSCFEVEVAEGIELNQEVGAQKQSFVDLKREAAEKLYQAAALGETLWQSLAAKIDALGAFVLRLLDVGFKVRCQMPPIQLPAFEAGISGQGVRVGIAEVLAGAPAA